MLFLLYVISSYFIFKIWDILLSAPVEENRLGMITNLNNV